MDTSYAVRSLLVVALVPMAMLTGCSAEPPSEQVASRSDEDHSWNGYHWARTSSGQLSLDLGDNLSADWDPFLTTVSRDWSASSVLNAPIATGAGGRNCKANVGRVEVCNRKYGFNGWLGLAQIWLSGGHIIKANAKVNDSYFQLSRYNDANAKQHVLCQEVGHTFGLDHQHGVESCMNDSEGLTLATYASPNAHDLEELEILYAHQHASAATATSEDSSSPEDAESFGAPTRRTAHETRFELDVGFGVKKVTWVRWAD